MTTPFDTEPLTSADIRPAYPLIQSALPQISLADWTRFARRMLDPRQQGRRGIRVVRGPKSFPSGLFCYRAQDDLEAGRVLWADHIIAIDFLESRPVTTALLDGLEHLAHLLGCGVIQATLNGVDDDLSPYFDSAGHRDVGTLYRKPLPAASETSARRRCR
jgi:hypothetical protein